MSRLRAAIGDACDGAEEWPAKVAAAICAVLDLAAREQAAARALTAASFDPDERKRRLYWEEVNRWASALRAGSPKPEQVPTAADNAAIAGIAAIVADRVRTERSDQLSALAPDLVQLVLLPHLGFEEARHWAERTRR